MEFNDFFADRQIAFFVEKNLLQAYRDLAQHVMKACNQSTKLAKIPMQVRNVGYNIGAHIFFSFRTKC
jgi:hypothetical protein